MNSLLWMKNIMKLYARSILHVSDILVALFDPRPVVGCKGTLTQQGEPAKFFGHLVLDMNKRQRQRDVKVT